MLQRLRSRCLDRAVVGLKTESAAQIKQCEKGWRVGTRMKEGLLRRRAGGEHQVKKKKTVERAQLDPYEDRRRRRVVGEKLKNAGV